MNNQERILSILVQRNDFSNLEKRTLLQIFDTEGRLPVIGLELQSEEQKLYQLISRKETGGIKESEG